MLFISLAVNDGVAQKKKSNHRAGDSVLYAPDTLGGAVPAQQANYPQGLEAWQPVP